VVVWSTGCVIFCCCKTRYKGCKLKKKTCAVWLELQLFDLILDMYAPTREGRVIPVPSICAFVACYWVKCTICTNSKYMNTLSKHSAGKQYSVKTKIFNDPVLICSSLTHTVGGWECNPQQENHTHETQRCASSVNSSHEKKHSGLFFPVHSFEV